MTSKIAAFIYIVKFIRN